MAAPGLRVELPGRLIRQEEGGSVGERAGNRDALLFAAGQLVRPVVGAAAQAHHLEQLVHAPVPLPRLGLHQPERHLDVLRGRQDGHQAEGLEDEADIPAAELDELGLRQLRNR